MVAAKPPAKVRFKPGMIARVEKQILAQKKHIEMFERAPLKGRLDAAAKAKFVEIARENLQSLERIRDELKEAGD